MKTLTDLLSVSFVAFLFLSIGLALSITTSRTTWSEIFGELREYFAETWWNLRSLSWGVELFKCLLVLVVIGFPAGLIIEMCRLVINVQSPWSTIGDDLGLLLETFLVAVLCIW